MMRPTGFMVIKRSVFEKMIEAYPELNYVSDSDYSPENKGLHYRFFDCMVDPESKRYLSETTPSATSGVKSAAKYTSTYNPT